MEQIPAASGNIQINDIEYNGEIIDLSNPNPKITFTPSKEGVIALKIKICDDVDGEYIQDIVYDCLNPEIKVSISGQESDIKANIPTTFNFGVDKANYHGKFYFQLVPIPVSGGKIKIGGKDYDMGKVEITNKNSNVVEFTPLKTGATILKLVVTDEWGKSTIKDINYSISNTDISVSVKENEPELLLNKEIEFQFNITKPNYSGKFKAKVISEQENVGKIKINGSAHDGNYVVVQPNNTVSFTPQKAGSVLLKLIITDDLGGEKEIPVSFNVTNPEISVKVTNKENNLIFKTPTTFNLAASKEFYSDNFDILVETVPEACGNIFINGLEYKGGMLPVTDPRNILVKFTPFKEGRISLVCTLRDKVNGQTVTTLDFDVVNPPVTLNVSGQTPDVKVNIPTSFNFNVDKSNYTGKLFFQITQEPAGSGKIKIGGEDYDMGKVEITDKNSNVVEFTPLKTGAAILKLVITDEWGKSTIKEINYSVSNTDITVDLTGNERDLLLNKETNFDFEISKPDYQGNFKVKIVQDQENAGTIKLNNNSHTGEFVAARTSNTVSFIPQKTGAILLKIVVMDDLGGMKEVPVSFNVTNPEISVKVTNKENNLIFKTPTTFNLAASKEFYSDNFDMLVETIPEACGNIFINGLEYKGGMLPVIDPRNILVKFTPSKEGRISLVCTLRDKVNGQTITTLDFDVENPPIALNVSGQTPDVKVNTPSSFNFNVNKSNYTGKLFFQITQEPAGSGKIKIGGKDYDMGKVEITDKNSNVVEFTPFKTGAAILKLVITDEWEKTVEKEISYSVSNTDITVDLTGNERDLLLNKETNFDFEISKPDYQGNFKVKIVQDQQNAGTIKLNNNSHAGEFVTTRTSNTVSFIPRETGAILLKIVVMDDLGGMKEVPVSFNVTNPPINIISNINDNEDITINSTKSFSTIVNKNSYSGKFKYRLSISPSVSGKIDVDKKIYTGGIEDVHNPNNLQIDFTATREGYATVLLEIWDETNQKSEKRFNFTILNPSLDFAINNSTTDVTIGAEHSFSIEPKKQGYSGNFNYQITQYPYAGCIVSINGKTETSGIFTSLTDIKIKPLKIGTIVLSILVSDEWGKSIEKQLDFNVSNTPIILSFVNQESNCVLNTKTSFNFLANKQNYADNETLTYSITSLNNGSIAINGTKYTGNTISTTYAQIKQGFTVDYTPTREGINSLTFAVTDQYNSTTFKTIDFNVSNPNLSLSLSGVNLVQPNNVILGETFKFAYNISKEHYNDDFAYIITLNDANAGIIATSDITPRIARNGGTGMLSGIIHPSEFSITTGEIRFTPNNPDYLNKEVTINIEIRDKWNNKTSQTCSFLIKTSAISVNAEHKTSIIVEEPYIFHFSVSKPGYNGKFKFSMVGFDTNDGDIIEISGDGNKFSNYLGGKFEIPNVDHTYIRFTPSRLGTLPLKLYVYTEDNAEILKDITFDVKAPEVRLATNRTNATGFVEEFLPFTLTANDEKQEDLSINIAPSGDYNGVMRFNKQEVNLSARSVTSFNVKSGVENNLEMMSREPGTYTAISTAKNRFNKEAQVNTSIQVSKKVLYSITTNKIGQGSIEKTPNANNYEAGTTIIVTAKPASGWKFVRWQGDLSSTNNVEELLVNGDKNIVAVFQQNTFKLTTNVSGQGSISRSPNTDEFTEGANATLTAIPASGWKFVRWEGDYFGTNITINVPMTSAKTVTAVFQQLQYFTLKVSTANARINIMPKQDSYLEGTEVEILVIPSTGWKVDYWSDDHTYKSTRRKIIMDSDKQFSITMTRVQ